MEKMQKDYNELWLEAMDSLISARLRDLPYDKTFVCTITDDSEKDKGFYTVTDGTIEFQAYSEKTDYANNNQVYVTVPMGDMQYDRYIIGRYVSDSDNDPIVYVTPVEKVAPVHVMHDEDFTKVHKVQHTAYDSKAVVLFNGALPVPIDTEVCDTVAIRAKFKTPVSWATIPMDMSSAEYGIRLYAYTDGESSTKASFIAELNSAQDMFGNPFGYVAPMLQQQAFRFTSSIGTLRFAKVEVYYKGPVKNLEGTPYYEDIEMSDIEIFFGADVSTVKTDTVKIYTNDSLTYSDTSGTSKTVNLIWYNKTPENKLIGFTDGFFDKDKAKDVKNIPEGDDNIYYWIDWLVDNANGSLEILEDEHKTSVNVPCRTDLPITEVSAKVWRNGIAYRAEEPIAFQNKTGLESDKISFMGAQISIEHVENSQDAYPIYGEWGGVINQADAYRKRTVRLAWSSDKMEIKDEFWKGATITWRIPEACMLIPEDTKLPIIDNYYTKVVTLNAQSTGTENSAYDSNGRIKADKLQFNYRVREVYNTSYVNNIIACEIALKGEKAEAKKMFSFSARGTYGTDYTIVVKPTDDRIYVPFIMDKNELTSPKMKDYELQLYDGNNNLVADANFDESTHTLSAIEGYNTITAVTTVPWAGKEVQLKTTYPVCYSSDGMYYAEAPTRILYDAFGSLLNLNSGRELKLFYLTDIENNKVVEHKAGEQVANIHWRIAPNYLTSDGSETEADRARERLAGMIPQITEKEGAYTLSIPNAYIDTGVQQYLVASKEGTVLWTSPLIIQQYRYESEVLNNWDGALKVDDKNNLIFAGAGIFGKKNDDNSFSGVTLGELKDFESGESAETGIIGFHEGAQSYGFRDDGTAFIGKSGVGRIHFDGKEGIIASGSWQQLLPPDEEKTYLDNYIEQQGNYETGFPEEGALLDLSRGALYLDGETASMHFDGSNLKLIYGSDNEIDKDNNITTPGNQVIIGSGDRNDDVLGEYHGISVIPGKDLDNVVFLGSTNVLGEHGRKVFHAGKTKSENIFTQRKVKGDNPFTNKVDLGVQAFEIFEDGYFYAPSASIGGTPPITAQQKITIISAAGNSLYEGATDFELSADIGVKTTKRFDFSDRPFVFAKYSWQYWSDNESRWKNCTDKNGDPIGSGAKTTIPFDNNPLEIGNDALSLNPAFTFADEDFLRWFWPDTEEPLQQDISGKFKITATIGQWEEQGVDSNKDGKVEKWYIYASDDKNAELQNIFSNDLSDEITITRIFGQKSDFTVSYYKRTSTTEELDSKDRPTGVTFKQQNDDTENKWYRSIPAASQENGLILDPYVWVTSATLNYKMTKEVPGTAWSTPALITDATGRLEVRYAFEEYINPNPGEDTEQDKDWYDVAVELPPDDKTVNDAIWMAVRNSYTSVVTGAEGVKWSEWTVTRIKGNDAYVISLSNDSVSVGIDIDGTPIGLPDVSLTEVKVLRGEEDITANDDIGIEWKTNNCTGNLVNNNDKSKYWVSALSDSSDDITVTVRVTRTIPDKPAILIGDKVMTITKIPSTATYKLIASPQVINMAETNRKIQFTVHKYANGKTAEVINEGGNAYKILDSKGVGINNNPLTVGDGFTGETYSLQIDGVIWDKETVDVTRGAPFTSTVFTRTEVGTMPSTPSRTGSYNSPLPTDTDSNDNRIWTDGIPTDSNNSKPLVWYSQALFKNINNFKPDWSAPVLSADEENKFDVQYSKEETPSQNPTDLNDWFDPSSASTTDLSEAIWMATRSRKNGAEWSEWSIVRIKGEQGPSGTSPYSIELSNDSATIGAKADGTINEDVLRQVSTTTVTVYEGSKDITGNCDFAWSKPSGDEFILNDYDTKMVYFTKLNVDNASVTVTVTRKGTSQVLGTKTFTISKNKQGENAVSYKLIATPNSWNSSKETSPTITLTVMRLDGTTAAPITTGYQIKIGETVLTTSSQAISDTTKFDLYVETEKDKYILMDSEVVTRVQDGTSAQGDKGTSTESIRIYYRTTIQAPSFGTVGTPTDKKVDGEWTTCELKGTEANPYVFTCTGVKTTEYRGNVAQNPSYGNWTAPELYRVYNGFYIDQKNYATFLQATNFNKKQGLSYDGEGNVMINAGIIKTGSLIVAPTDADGVQDLEHPFLSIDMSGDDEGRLYARNMSIDTNFLHLDDKLFTFGSQFEDEDNAETYINFSDTGSDRHSYLQSVNYGKIETAGDKTVVVYKMGTLQRGGECRTNGKGTTSLGTYSTASDIYLLLEQVYHTNDQGELEPSKDENGNLLYTYISKQTEKGQFRATKLNESVYGRWLKCIWAKGYDDKGKIISWIEGTMYPGGGDQNGPFLKSSVQLPGTGTYANATAAAIANATLKRYLTFDKDSVDIRKTNPKTTGTGLCDITCGKVINNNGSKFDLFNGRIYLGPYVRLNAGVYGGKNYFAIDILDPDKGGGKRAWMYNDSEKMQYRNLTKALGDIAADGGWPEEAQD